MKYNKILFITLALLALLFVNTNNVEALHTITVTTPVESNPGDTATFTINIDNSDGASTALSVTSTDLTLGTNTITAPTIASKTIGTTATETMTFTVSTPAKPAGDYSGTVTVKNNTTTVATLPYVLRIKSKAQFSTD